MKPKHPAGPPMTLGNMRERGVQRLIASCLNDACRHTALIEVGSYPAETEIPYFSSRVVCAKCGSLMSFGPGSYTLSFDLGGNARGDVAKTRRSCSHRAIRIS